MSRKTAPTRNSATATAADDEIHDHATVFTLDADFAIYRKSGRCVIKGLSPDSC